MIAPRRFLPSISSLLALEAVDRLGTAAAAAQDLSLTHSAISRQLKVLEEQIGVTMFHRGGKTMELSPAGAAYAQSVREFLNDLARASLRVKASGSRPNLNLAILPTFGMYWLGPRIRSFAKEYPDILINQRSRTNPQSVDLDDIDAAIHFGAERWPGVAYLPLLKERVIAVCAPDYSPDLPFEPVRLLNEPLLHLESRPGAWEEWFKEHDIRATKLRGMLFDQFANIAEATAAGLGVSLVPEFLAAREFARGRLVPASSTYVDVEGTYFLTWSTQRPMTEQLATFIDWLKQ